MKPKILISGLWYEMGNQQDRRKIGYTYIESDLQSVFASGFDGVAGECDYPLTPIDTPIEWKLGANVLASVDEEVRPRVTGEFRATNREAGEHWFDTGYGHEMPDSPHCTWNSSPSVILSPEPNPKTDRDVLEDLVSAYFRGASALEERADAARKHLETTQPELP